MLCKVPDSSAEHGTGRASVGLRPQSGLKESPGPQRVHSDGLQPWYPLRMNTWHARNLRPSPHTARHRRDTSTLAAVDALFSDHSEALRASARMSFSSARPNEVRTGLRAWLGGSMKRRKRSGGLSRCLEPIQDQKTCWNNLKIWMDLVIK